MPKPFAILVAVLMALYFVPLNALPASATVPSFEIDGNQTHDSAEDWKDLTPTQSGDLVDSGGKTNRHLVTFVDNTTATGQDDTLFGSNNKEEGTGGLQWPDWVPTNNGNATGKSDFGRLAFYSYVENGHVFFVLGFDRGSNVGGTATDDYYFELNHNAQSPATNPNPDRTDGDVRIKLDDQGAGNITATLQVWDSSLNKGDGGWAAAPNLGDYRAASNSSGPISDLAPWWTGLNVNANGSIDKEGFLEASFDLTSFGVVLGCPSTGFSTVNGRSTTGNADKNLVDYFAATPLHIPSSCANLVIHKVDGNGDPLGGATFSITPNPLPLSTPNRPNSNTLTIFDDSTSNTTVEPGTNYDDPDATAGTITLPAVIPGQQYTITETVPPAGYIGSTAVKTVTPAPFSEDNAVSFTNTLGSVKFFKTYAGGLDAATGATFTVTRDANTNNDFTDEPASETTTVVDNGANDADNTLGAIKVTGLKTGNYEIVETAAPVGYNVDPTKVHFSIPGANNTADVVIGSAGSPSFTNPRKTYSLTVRKVAKADNSVLIQGATFDLYKETNSTAGLQTGAGGDTKAGTCTTGANGECTVSGLAWGKDYYWVETSVPAPYNLPSVLVQGPIHIDADGTKSPSGTTVYEDPQSKIVTQATDGNQPSATISDTATLSGLNSSASGTVTFDLYFTGANPPTANSCVAGNLVKTAIPATAAVTGNGSYTTGPVSVANAGYYAWVAHYSGDNNGNRAVDGHCNDANETSHVSPLQPGITTVAQAPDDQLPGAELYDTAKVVPVTGNLDTSVANVDFYLYGPDDATCSNTAVFTSLNRSVTVTSDGKGGFFATAESEHFTPTLAGTYRWVAQFDGDASNKDVDGTCNADNESSTVKKAVPSVSTDAGADKQLGPNGVSLQDKATLSGGTTDPAITGTITFKLYYSTSPIGANDCTDANYVAGSQSSATVSGNGDYLSTAVNVSKAGYYNWTADYDPSGDANNADIPVHGCGLSSENVTVTPAQPTIVTSATDAQLPDGTVSDTATVSGLVGGDPAGKVTFTLYGPSDTMDCTDNQVFTKTVDLGAISNHQAQASSGSFTPTLAGTYWWVASYAGNADNSSVSGACGDAGETSTVSPANPAISTTATDAKLPAGTIHDVAHLTGLSGPNTAAGTVTFSLWGPSDSASCSGSPVFTDTQPLGTVTAGGAATVTSGDFTPAVAGSYWWIASYHSTNANNTDVSGLCGDTGEKSVVSPATPKITTVADASATLPTGTLTDTAHLTGLSASPTGTVTFRLYGPDATPGTPTCDAGSLVFTSDAVDISPTGSGTASATSTPAFTPSVTGTYFWIASYTGDPNNDPVAGACGDANEISTVEKAGPAITTQVPHATEQLSPTATLTDTATLSGATTSPAATGTITFSLYGPFDTAADISCAGAPIDTRTATVNGNGSYSPATGITVHVVGFYTWVAEYSGDANNESAVHACGLANETVHVLPTQGTITTDALDHVKLSDGPTTISDQATLSGVTTNPAAGGTIEFKVYGPFASQPDDQSCTAGNLVGGGPYTVTVNGPGTYTSPDVTVKKAGFYVWVASYSGDANNSSATHPCGQVAETTTVDKATPTVTTQVAAASVSLPNASLMDTATLSGGTSDPKATGTITFRLYGPFSSAPGVESCLDGEGGNNLATEVVNVTNGNGSYPSPAVVVNEAGYYTWVATYSGDDNNEGASNPCGEETETTLVAKAQPTVATVATESMVIKLGGSISDSATVSGLASAGSYGSVTFALFGPDDATCDTTPVFTSTVALVVTDNGDGTASGTASSGSFSPTAAGTYRWIATYQGDDNNTMVAGACNDPNEQSQVFAGDHPTLDKDSSPASGSVVQPGSTIDYTVTVGNTGDVAITNADVVDILPAHVTVKPGTISDGGVLADGVITWKVSLAPGASHTFTYSVTVDQAAPEGAVLLNTAKFLGLQDTTSHVVPTGDLTIFKKVSPVAGNGVVVNFGDTLTYTLTATATGTLDQPDTIITDYLPGRDPAHPTSGKTHYVAGSAKCLGAGACTVTGPDASGKLTWNIGTLAAGTSRQVTFQVTIDDVTGPAGSTISVDILNAGAVKSSLTPTRPSNLVKTPVSKVLPVKVGPKELPHTGATFPVGPTVGGGILLLGLGILLLATSRRRRWDTLG